MASQRPSDGSPTPRKKQDGGNFDHPTLFDDEDITKDLSGLSLLNRVYDPQNDVYISQKKQGKLPQSISGARPHANNRSNSSYDAEDRQSTAGASDCLAGELAAARTVAASHNPGSSINAFPGLHDSSSLTSSSGSYMGLENSRGESTSTTSSYEEELVSSYPRNHDQGYASGGLPKLTKSRSTNYEVGAPQTSSYAPSHGLGIIAGPHSDSASTGNVHRQDFANFIPSQQQGPWNHSFVGNQSLVHGSVPKYGAKSTPIPQLPFNGPGVIGQPTAPTSYRFSNTGNQYQHFQSTPYTQPLPQGQFPRTNKFGYRGRRFANGHNAGHGFDDRSSFGYNSALSSRAMTPASPYGSLPPSMTSSTTSLPSGGQYAGPMNYTPQTSSGLSPTATEFSASSGASFMAPTPWNDQPREMVQSNYVLPTEPLNYRRLLDKDVSTDWKMIVDKIICGNDQQASLFLQQKIKTGGTEQKQAIIQIIISQGKHLMLNRFGNFLIQRCMEHGTPANILDIAERICGHTVELSMDAFGCHVVQKAFDYAPEKQKRLMINDLLMCVKDTIIHRYACHVWQKLFELRWEGTRPEIMKFVNADLQNMWHEVALGETGSLVVQNIFENCTEEEKRPCIDEVLRNISVIATGQFGNWCIQHICEHGSPSDQAHAINHILMFASRYSTDQFASKVVEKCLKVCGNEFLDRYLEKICAYRPDVPRMDLIDIAGDQYGNYLIQYILTSADPSRREIVAGHIRKHMVSLRGSKYGSRVAMLCTGNGYNARSAGAIPAPDRAPGGALTLRDDYGRTGPWGIPRPGGSYHRGY
ncbi:hypothetical protein B9Z65_2299 [Elsinoe australis]|uniref:PUM-HD domain-containing protein n=1 Tax=Elsinoe australis TaxID=40998 RepID=A0A2P7ZAB7_9PEZI|nr:hypothetical protein B9Z65_2299 [Elsinoe australis]